MNSIEGVAIDKAASRHIAIDPNPNTKRSRTTRTLIVKLTKIAAAKSRPARRTQSCAVVAKAVSDFTDNRTSITQAIKTTASVFLFLSIP
jgi:hypothetical protein